MVDRRQFIKNAGVASTLGIAGLGGCLGGDGGGADTVSFQLSPAESEVDIQAQYQPLFDYLESEADVTVESSVAADYSAIAQSLGSGQTDLADAAPAIAIQTGNEGTAEVAGIRVAFGAARYFSLITTLPEYDIESLTDLEETTVAFADSLSTSGSLFPLFALAEAGLDVGEAPTGEAADFTGQWSDHSTARETLVNRDEVRAAGTGAFSVSGFVSGDDPELSEEFRDVSAEMPVGGDRDELELDVLHTSSPIPRAPILARSDWDEEVKGRCVDALLAAEKDDLIDEDAEEELWFSGVVEGTVAEYDPVKEVIETLGVELGQ